MSNIIKLHEDPISELKARLQVTFRKHKGDSYNEFDIIEMQDLFEVEVIAGHRSRVYTIYKHQTEDAKDFQEACEKIVEDNLDR